MVSPAGLNVVRRVVVGFAVGRLIRHLPDVVRETARFSEGQPRGSSSRPGHSQKSFSTMPAWPGDSLDWQTGTTHHREAIGRTFNESCGSPLVTQPVGRNPLGCRYSARSTTECDYRCTYFDCVALE